MKQLFFSTVTLLLISCSHENTKEAENPTKYLQVICDTLTETNLDSLGNEIVIAKWHCDTIKENQ